MQGKEVAKPDIRIAFLSDQVPEYKEMEPALRNVFEKIIAGVSDFAWGHRLQNEYDTYLRRMDNGFGRGGDGQNPVEQLRMQVPAEMALTVSLLIEQVALVHQQRQQSQNIDWEDRKKTFSIALYEVVSGNTLGRVKVLGQVSFYESAVGGARMTSDELNGDAYHRMPHYQGTKFECVQVVGLPKLATPEIRAELLGRLGKAKATK